MMHEFYSKNELLELGFSEVSDQVIVSKDARFFSISGFLKSGVRIDAYAILTGHVELHQNVHISPFCFLGGTGGTIIMKDNSGVASHVSVYTKTADYGNVTIANQSKITGNVEIGENAIIGSGCKIMPNVVIEKNSSIGCNCIIASHVTEGSILVNRGLGLITVGNRA